MGLFKKITKGIQSSVKGVKKGIKQIPQEARNAVNSAVRFQGSIIQGVATSATDVVQGVGQVAGAATKVLNDNPLPGQALGGMIPGMGGLFGGGGSAAAPMEYAPQAEPAPASKVPMWVWIAAGGAALVGLVLILKRKKAS